MPSDLAISRSSVNFEPPADFGPVRVQFSVPEADRRKFWVRWPAELAACVEIIARPSERFVLAEIVRLADEDGKSWPSVDRLARTIPRSGAVPDGHGRLVGSNRPTYSKHTIRVALRRLRLMGLLVWERIWSFGHYPSRTPGVKGPQTSRGGRVWWPNLRVLGMFAHAKRAGEDFTPRKRRSANVAPVIAQTLAPPPPAPPSKPLPTELEPMSRDELSTAIETLGKAMGVRPTPLEELKRPGST